ncbi:unnamed protein product [Ambrosiozyma monospora]|uniref:Unnamed protein product n=1 Tax=Ambrosiozyma monospora TaxID=43982 RepID=A0A9W6Z2N7_AMBMO|nr:unnamed protein product [Ambrosiozyma monospora]
MDVNVDVEEEKEEEEDDDGDERISSGRRELLVVKVEVMSLVTMSVLVTVISYPVSKRETTVGLGINDGVVDWELTAVFSKSPRGRELLVVIMDVISLITITDDVSVVAQSDARSHPSSDKLEGG